MVGVADDVSGGVFGVAQGGALLLQRAGGVAFPYSAELGYGGGVLAWVEHAVEHRVVGFPVSGRVLLMGMGEAKPDVERGVGVLQFAALGAEVGAAGQFGDAADDGVVVIRSDDGSAHLRLAGNQSGFGVDDGGVEDAVFPDFEVGHREVASPECVGRR